MRKVFEVELNSPDCDAYAALTLPALPHAMLDALERLGLAEGQLPQWRITRAYGDRNPFSLTRMEGTLPELNALALRLTQLNETELAIVDGLAIMAREWGGPSIPITQAIDMTYSTDCCHIIEEAADDQTLGRFCAENGFVPEAESLSDEAFALLDFERIGRQFRQNERGVFTSSGYVQRWEELKQVSKNLDFTLKKPGYTILAELPDGSRVELPTPLGKTVVEEPAQCVDCAAPALNGLTAMRSTLDLLAFRLAELEVDGELTKYKAVLVATGCEDIAQALTLADGLDQYAFDPEPREPDEVASGHLKGLLPEEELTALLPNVVLYRYGQALMEQSGGKLTGYGYVRPAAGPVQDMIREQTQAEGMSFA